MRFTRVLFLALSLSGATMAETGSPAPKRVASRKPATSDLRATGQTPRAKKSWDLRVGIAGGYAQLNTNDPQAQSVRNATSTNNTIFGTIGADLTAWKYFGVNVEGYYGKGGSGSKTVFNEFASTVTTTKYSLSQYGGMADAGGRYPFWLGRVKLIPRAGVGFGILDLTSSAAITGGSANDGTETRLTGAYATAGLEIDLLPELYLTTDYARSFAASGTVTATADGTGTASAAGSPRFDRLRAGIYYRVTSRFTVGTEYLRRTLTTSTTETSNQFLGSVGVSF
jgi:hypothetical protein